MGYYTLTNSQLERLAAYRAEVEAKTRASAREEAFVQLFAAAKQLVDNHPKRFPSVPFRDLEFQVREIESRKLAPPLIQEDSPR
jgi:hypothetical protein